MKIPSDDHREELHHHWAGYLVEAAARLRIVLDKAATLYPDAQIYITPGTIFLLTGDHHEGTGAKARHDRVIAAASIDSRIDMGDW